MTFHSPSQMKLFRLHDDRSPLKFGSRAFCNVGTGLTRIFKSPREQIRWRHHE